MDTTTPKPVKKTNSNTETKSKPVIDHANSNMMRKALRLVEIMKEYPLAK